jgi:hypothetical protein
MCEKAEGASMKKYRKLLALGLFGMAFPAHAAPVEQIDCILSQWSDADRYDALQYFGAENEEGAAEKELPSKIAGPLMGCTA